MSQRRRKKPQAEGAEQLLRELSPIEKPDGLSRRVIEQLRAEQEASHRRHDADTPFLHAKREDRTPLWGFLKAPLGRRLALSLAAGFFASAVVLAALVWPLVRQSIEERNAPKTQARGSGELIRLTASRGRVWLERDTRVFELEADDALRDGDRIRTEESGSAILELADGGEIVVDASSELVLLSIHETVLHFAVRRGRVEATAASKPDRAELLFRDSGREAALLSGSIGILRLAPGKLAIAALDDHALVEVAGRRIRLPHGFALPLSDERSLAEPQRLPDELMLTMRQLNVVGSDRRLVIEGKTHPDVLLVINDETVAVDASGAFVAELDLERDTDLIKASVVDAAGRRHRSELAVRRVTTRVPWKEPG